MNNIPPDAQMKQLFLAIVKVAASAAGAAVAQYAASHVPDIMKAIPPQYAGIAAAVLTTVGAHFLSPPQK